MLGSPVGIAAGTMMIETTMKLVDSMGQGIVPVYEIGIDDGLDGLFAPVIFGKLVGRIADERQALDAAHDEDARRRVRGVLL